MVALGERQAIELDREVARPGAGMGVWPGRAAGAAGACAVTATAAVPGHPPGVVSDGQAPLGRRGASGSVGKRSGGASIDGAEPGDLAGLVRQAKEGQQRHSQIDRAGEPHDTKITPAGWVRPGGCQVRRERRIPAKTGRHLRPCRSFMPAFAAIRFGAGVTAGVGAGVKTGLRAGVRTGVSAGITAGVTAGVSTGVKTGLRTGVSAGITAGVGTGIAAGVSTGVRVRVGAGVGAGVSAGTGSGGCGSSVEAGVRIHPNAAVDPSVAGRGRIPARVTARTTRTTRRAIPAAARTGL
jgi:hypothetical protein